VVLVTSEADVVPRLFAVGATTNHGPPMLLAVIVLLVMCGIGISFVVVPARTKGKVGPLSPSHGDRVSTSNRIAVTSLTLSGVAMVAEERGWLPSPIAGVLLVVFFALFAIFCVLTLVILVWNRPKFLLPPHHRGTPGLWHEWRAKRRIGS
jgi:hypothetical protein